MQMNTHVTNNRASNHPAQSTLILSEDYHVTCINYSVHRHLMVFKFQILFVFEALLSPTNCSGGHDQVELCV